MKKLAFLFILNISPGYALNCIDLYNTISAKLGKAYEGRKLNTNELEIFLGNYPEFLINTPVINVFLIKKGHRNMGIYRITYENPQEDKIIKFYNYKQLAETDTKKMSNLRSWFPIIKSSNNSFRIAPFIINPINENSSSVMVQNIYGRTLADLLQDDEIGQSVKNSLRNIFLKKANHYVSVLKAKGLTRNLQFADADLKYYFHPQFSEPRAPRNEEGYYYLKPDQVIVDVKTFEMWIIDPF